MSHFICSVDAPEVAQPIRVLVEGVPIALVKTAAGTIHAIGDTCTHGDISLSEGFVEGDTLECWAHGSKFSLVTGQPSTLPAYEPVPVYRVELDGDDIYLDPADIVEPAAEQGA